MSRTPSEIDKIADAWTTRMAELSPGFATYIGYPGGEDRLDDESPEAAAAFIQEEKAVLAKLLAATPVDDTDRVTIDAMRNRIELAVETYDAGLHHRNMNVIASPAQGIRDIFDLSPTATENDWKNLVGRMNDVANALEGYERTLQQGIDEIGRAHV